MGNITAYDTLILRNKQGLKDSVNSALQRILLLGNDDDIEKLDDGKIVVIKGEFDKMPSLANPMLVKSIVVVDARPLVNRAGEIKIGYEYPMLLERARLELLWQSDPDMFQSNVTFIVDAWSQWVTGALTNKLSLSATSMVDVKIITATYYLGVLHRAVSKDVDIDDINVQLLKLLPRILKIPASVIDERVLTPTVTMLAELYTEHTLAMLIETLNSITNDDYSIDTGLLFNVVVGGAIVANNASEIAAISLEHPPTFFSMVHLTLSKGIQARTNLGRVVNGISRKHDIDTFNRLFDIIANGD